MSSIIKVPEERLRTELLRRLTAPSGAAETKNGLAPATDEFELDLSQLAELSRIMQESSYKLGSLPPAPTTSRGRMGALLVRLVRRMLSWYTSQIAAFHSLAARSSREVLLSLRHQNHAILAAKLDAARLSQDLSSVRAEWADQQADHRERVLALEQSVARMQAELHELKTSMEHLRR